MTIRRILAVAVAAAFIAGSAAAQNKAAIQKENRQLRYELDSLKAELARTQAELKYTDSVANEMLSLYADSEVKNNESVAPEEYTTEVSDSLLNLW